MPLAGAVILFAVANVWKTAIAAALMSGYWEARMREPVAADGYRLVALGDSSAMGVGADGYWYWFTAFRPQVDIVLERLSAASATR